MDARGGALLVGLSHRSACRGRDRRRDRGRRSARFAACPARDQHRCHPRYRPISSDLRLIDQQHGHRWCALPTAVVHADVPVRSPSGHPGIRRHAVAVTDRRARNCGRFEVHEAGPVDPGVRRKPAGRTACRCLCQPHVVGDLGRRRCFVGLHCDPDCAHAPGRDQPEYADAPPRPHVSGALQRSRSKPQPWPKDTPPLQVVDLGKSFGGIIAVRNVSFDVRAGEVVGLIGPNGAGKTTTFELISGFVRPDHGRVIFGGSDVTRHSPERLARAGLIRSFQDAALFPTLTVEQAIRLAFERTDRSSLPEAITGWQRTERRRAAHADEILAMTGLAPYRDRAIGELSTGTRRIAEIACVIALGPRCLLLDEPSAGIAQRDTEALGLLLAELRRELDLTMVIIEHDIPLIMSLADRIVVMAGGELVTSGAPDAVRNDPRVVDAYLGTMAVAIARSDQQPTPSGGLPERR